MDENLIEPTDAEHAAESPTLKKPLPISLKIVAFLFILVGLNTLPKMVTEISNTGHTTLNVLVFGILIGIGLLQRSRPARKFALGLIWFDGLFVTGIVMYSLASPSRITFNGQPVQSNWLIPVIIMLFLWACFIALSVWMYRVLTKPEVRALFYKPQP